jgi:hypothetical protein
MSGTFMADDTTDNATNVTLSDDFYLHLSINLTHDWVSSLSYSISRAWDGSLPLSNDEISELGISVKIEPRYWYYQQLHSLPDEFLALSERCNISDPQTYMLHLLENIWGPIHFFPEPYLPLHWERHISDEGTSYFYNQKTSGWVWSPEEAFTCLYLPLFSFQRD